MERHRPPFTLYRPVYGILAVRCSCLIASLSASNITNGRGYFAAHMEIWTCICLGGEREKIVAIYVAVANQPDK